MVLAPWCGGATWTAFTEVSAVRFSQLEGLSRKLTVWVLIEESNGKLPVQQEPNSSFSKKYQN